MVWWIVFALVLAGFGYLVYLIYLEVRNQHHWWHDNCVTPAQTIEDIRHVAEVFRQVLEGKGITWWLDYGTLLGAWRLGETMAFDHDLDMSFLLADAPKMLACCEELQAHGIELRLENTSIYYRGRKIGDFDTWQRFGDTLCRNDPAGREGLLKVLWPLVDDFPAAWVEPPMQIRYNGEYFPCPANTARFLRRRYLTCRLHLRMVFAHKQKCWLCRAFWREVWRIWTCRTAPDIRPR